jgi:uncharacterized protein (DUF1800 family)
MKRFFILAAAILILQASATGEQSVRIPTDDKAITHALNRLAFGPTPEQVEEVKRVGLAAWIDRQLHPERIKDDDLDARLARLETIDLDAQTIAEEYIAPARRERRERQLKQQADGNGEPMMQDPAMRRGQGQAGGQGQAVTSAAARKNRQVFSELAEAKLLRAVYSERQLEEVLVDFWFNHFNVFGRKGQTEIYITEYERDVIRPHVFGNFRELLGATAKSPAMLFYLDNWMSVDPNAPALKRRPQNATNGQNRARGLNENYARELMELHTLGVDGGYTQKDVVEVARALTGWTIGQPRQGGGFRFAAALHDRGEKRVLGHTIPAGGGVDDGERVLDIVANHPSTAKHIAFKLAQRFVSDTPPQALVDRAAARFRDTKGDLREVVRTIITSPEFFAPETYRAKVKTPFEFVASALRATGADVSSGMPVARALAGMGMPLYLCQPPTGYDETAETWVSSGALVNRMNFAVELSNNKLRGIRVPAGRAALARATGEPDFQRQ